MYILYIYIYIYIYLNNNKYHSYIIIVNECKYELYVPDERSLWKKLKSSYVYVQVGVKFNFHALQ